jgi:hypothetical protein
VELFSSPDLRRRLEQWARRYDGCSLAHGDGQLAAAAFAFLPCHRLLPAYQASHWAVHTQDQEESQQTGRFWPGVSPSYPPGLPAVEMRVCRRRGMLGFAGASSNVARLQISIAPMESELGDLRSFGDEPMPLRRACVRNVTQERRSSFPWCWVDDVLFPRECLNTRRHAYRRPEGAEGTSQGPQNPRPGAGQPWRSGLISWIVPPEPPAKAPGSGRWTGRMAPGQPNIRPAGRRWWLDASLEMARSLDFEDATLCHYSSSASTTTHPPSRKHTYFFPLWPLTLSRRFLPPG